MHLKIWFSWSYLHDWQLEIHHLLPELIPQGGLHSSQNSRGINYLPHILPLKDPSAWLHSTQSVFALSCECYQGSPAALGSWDWMVTTTIISQVHSSHGVPSVSGWFLEHLACFPWVAVWVSLKFLPLISHSKVCCWWWEVHSQKSWQHPWRAGWTQGLWKLLGRPLSHASFASTCYSWP